MSRAWHIPWWYNRIDCSPVKLVSKIGSPTCIIHWSNTPSRLYSKLMGFQRMDIIEAICKCQANNYTLFNFMVPWQSLVVLNHNNLDVYTCWRKHPRWYIKPQWWCGVPSLTEMLKSFYRTYIFSHMNSSEHSLFRPHIITPMAHTFHFL